MIYSKIVTSPKGKAKATATRTDMAVTSGLVYQVELYLPPGGCGLVHVAIFDGGYQAWPSERGETFFGDNTLISFPDRYYVDSPQKAFTILHWNEDDTFDHIFQVRIGLASEEIFIGSYLPNVTMEKLQVALAQAAAAQEERSMELLRETAARLAT